MDTIVDWVWLVACVGFGLWGYVIGHVAGHQRARERG
jgi:hypothetical protein